MAKQSMKQQIYQSIANSQVQQVMAQKREQEIAQLQASFDAWNKQQDEIANLQAQYDSWLKEQPQAQPVQQATVNEVKEIPKLRNQVDLEDFFTPKTASGIEINKKKPTEEDLARAKVADITKRISNSIVPTEEQFNKQKNIEEGQTGRRSKAYKDSVKDVVNALNSKETKQANALADYNKKAEEKAQVDKWLSPDYKLTDEERKAAKKYANEELQKFAYDANKKPVNLKTQEDKERYAQMVNLLNKSNPFTNTMAGYSRLLANAGIGARDVGSDVVNQLTGLGAAIGDKLGITEGATQRHNEKVAENEAARQLTKDMMNNAYQNALTQNPKLTAAGELAGQVSMYALTNPAFDALGAAAGAGKVGSFALNQVGQNAQDLALDTLPKLNEMKEDGELSKEDYQDLGKNILGNAAFNMLIPALNVGNAKSNAVQFNQLKNVMGNPDILKNMDVNGLQIVPDAIREVAEAQEQAAKAAENIDNLAKQIPELPPEANVADDIKLSDSEVNNLLAKMEPVEAPKVDVENAIKPQLPQYDPEVEEKIFSDFEEIYRSMDNMNEAAIKSGDTKAIEKFEKLQKSVFDYEETIWKSGDTDEINKAKKAADAARQGFIRQMKKIDPSYTGELTGTKLGNAEYRLPQTISDSDAEEMVNGWVKEEMANPNRFVEDVSKRNVPGANQLQFFAEKNNVNDQLTELEKRRQQAMLDINEQARQAVLNENPEVARFSDPDADLKRLGSERAYREKQLDRLKTPEEREDEALDALTNYVNSQRQTLPPGGNGPTRNTIEEVVRNTPQAQRSNIPPSPPTGNNLTPEDQWKVSKWRTNTAENQGWGDNLPMKDYAYRVFTEAEQRAAAVERYEDIENIYSELMNTNQFDEIDVKMAMSEMQRLMDEGTPESLRQARMLGSWTAHQGRESGRAVQAFAEYNRNTAAGALTDANRAQEDLILEPWKSRNVKQREGNSRIAKALADMGNKWRGNKVKPELTHEQIKQGVKAEIEREMGSVEGILNDNDLEFLTIMAEDKSIPVWQITDEIEHRLNTGSWYTLDESIEPPKKLNTKLNNALKSLIETDAVRPEPVKPDLKQIRQEVVNTLGKESADFEGLFNDDDVDYLANLINNGATKDELSEALNMKMATGSWGISDETIQEVNNIFKQISQYDPNSKQFVEGQAEAYRLLANEIVPDATALEKFEAWRYIAMLGNPKTMLRNFIGNQTFAAVTGISNNIAAVAEAGIDKGIKTLGGKGIQRTKSVLNPITDSGLIKAAAEDADASRYRQMIGSKYEKMDKDALRRSKSVFKSKLARFYEKVTDAGISDYQAVKNKFSTSLAGYLKANGYDTNIFKAEDELQRLKNLRETRLLSDAERAEIDSLTKDVEALERARDYALKQAEYATFHEDNVVANLLTKFSREARNSDNLAAKGLGTIIEGVVPFKKTPANVLKSGIEYSPIGAIDSIRKTGKLIYENTGKRAGQLADTYLNKAGKEVQKTLASDVIDSWSKSLTGTGLTALGFYLYDKGIIHSSDPDTKYQDELEGHQNYSIEINGKSYTIDWAAPTVMPLMVGAEMAKLWDSNGKGSEDFFNNIDDYVAAANRLADPLVETSMLSGVKDTLETAANAAQYNENLNIPALAIYNALTGYATQGVPTISGQIARTVDPTRRSTYTDKEGVPGIVDKQIKKQMNKIPGLSTLNQPYVDTYGREQRNSPSDNPLFNLAYQMVSPGYLTDINTTDADTISREVFEKSGKADNVLPQWKSTFKFDGKRVSPEDYTKGAKVYGEAQKEIRDTLANDEWYNGLTPEEQTDIMKDINTLSEHAAKAAIDPEYATSSKPYTAYKEGGISGLMDYYKGQQAKNVAKESGLSSSSNASKAIQADVQAGNMEAAQEKVDAATYLQNNGLTKPGPSYTYYNAQDQIPSLTPEEFTKTYKAIDTNSNQGITQDELIAYLNKANVSESEGKKLWSAYGSTKWKAIPKLEGGTWKKGK